jgi:WD40 repeat protein
VIRKSLALVLVACGCHAPPTVTIAGTVIIAGDRDASGVSVRAVGPASAGTITDAEGNYRLPALPPGDYELVFNASDTLEGTQLAHVSAAATTRAKGVRFTAVGSVTGTVTLDGQPGRGATVLVDGASVVATADSAGSYRLDSVPAGTITVEAVLSGYRPGSLGSLGVTRGRVTTAPPLDLAVDDDPYAAATLSGTALRIDRNDHSGTMVTATLGNTLLTTTTAKDGTYHFDGVPTGLYRIDFSYDGHHESIPQVLALGGATGQIIDGALYPLVSNPIKLPVARRIADSGDVTPVDSERVLVQSGSVQTQQKLAVLSLISGALTLVADDVQQGGGVILSRDLLHMLYAAGTGYGLSALRLGSLDGTAPITLSPHSETYGYQFWSGDARVVFPATYQVIDSVATRGGSPTVLATGVWTSWRHPDGKRLVYQSCTGSNPPCTIWARTIDGGTPTRVLDNAPIDSGSYVLLAPDGGHVAALMGYDLQQHTGQIVLASVDTGTQSTLWNGVVKGVVSFSPDGRWAAFVTDGGDLRLADLRSATPTGQVVAQNVAAVLTFASDGRLFYARDVYNNFNPTLSFYTLLQQPLGGGTELTLGTRVQGYAFSPDGTRTAFVDQLDAASNAGRVRIADATGSMTTTLAPSGARAIRFSRDGAYVEYQTDDPANVNTLLFWSVPAAGGTPAQLAQMYPGFVESPSGARIAFVGADHVVHVSATKSGASQVAGIGYYKWASDTRLILNLSFQQPPFRHQNGIYVYEVTP